MPSLEAPSFNSSRVQRAYRINNIEQARLQQQLQLLEKERIHSMRVTNQDIRLISVTMDYIQSCSGHSPEGLGPEVEIPKEEKTETEDSGSVCFMYGERIVSRKRRRFRRPQSAMDSSSSRRSESQASIPAKVNSLIRPQSSPVKRDSTFITTLKDDSSSASASDTESVYSLSSNQSGYKQAWMDETNEITKILLRAKEKGPNLLDRRRSLYERQEPKLRTRGGSSSSFNFSSLAKELEVSKSDKNLEARRSSHSLGRNAGITDIMSQRRPTLSASAWKKHLNDARTSSAAPTTISAKRQQIMDMKLEMNEQSRAKVTDKVRTFMGKD